jgi:hypothetical protein
MLKRITSILLAVSLCAFLSACNDTAAPLVDTDTTESQAGFGDFGTPAENQPEDLPADNIDFENMPSFDLGFSEKTDEDGEPVFLLPEQFHAENGSINMNMVTNFTLPTEFSTDMMPSYVMVGVNGELYDFTLDGKKSSNGIVQIDIPIGKMLSAPLEISGLNLEEGSDNQFVFVMVPFAEDEMLHNMGPFLYDAPLTADKTTTGTSTVSIPDQSQVKNLEIETADGKSKDEIMFPHNGATRMFDEKDLLKEMDDTSNELTVKADTQLFLQFPNMNNENGPSNRSGICMVLDSGKPLNAWSGSPLMKLSLTENDIFVTVPVETSYKSGDKADLWMFYVDLYNSDAIGPYTFTNGNYLAFE